MSTHKIVILGEPAVGKTRIFTRFRDIGVGRELAAGEDHVKLLKQGKSKVTSTHSTTSTRQATSDNDDDTDDDNHDDNGEDVEDLMVYRQTIGLSLCVYTPQYPRCPQALRTEVWDSSGSEAYRAVTLANLTPEVSGAILVFDVTKRFTLDRAISFWWGELRARTKYNQSMRWCTALVGTHCDIERGRNITAGKGVVSIKGLSERKIKKLQSMYISEDEQIARAERMGITLNFRLGVGLGGVDSEDAIIQSIFRELQDRMLNGPPLCPSTLCKSKEGGLVPTIDKPQPLSSLSPSSIFSSLLPSISFSSCISVTDCVDSSSLNNGMKERDYVMRREGEIRGQAEKERARERERLREREKERERELALRASRWKEEAGEEGERESFRSSSSSWVGEGRWKEEGVSQGFSRYF